MGAIVFAITLAACLALSYAATAGTLWLICLCFGWTWWSWQAALGVWLVLVLVKATVGRGDR